MTYRGHPYVHYERDSERVTSDFPTADRFEVFCKVVVYIDHSSGKGLLYA